MFDSLLAKLGQVQTPATDPYNVGMQTFLYGPRMGEGTNDYMDVQADAISARVGKRDPDPEQVGDWRTPTNGQDRLIDTLRWLATQHGDQWSIDMLRQMGVKGGYPGGNGVALMPPTTGYQALTSGGGSGGGGGTGGGGGAPMPDVNAGAPADPGAYQEWLAANGYGGLSDQVNAETMTDLQLDPMWRERMLAIADRMQGLEGRLIDLNPELAAELDKVIAASRGQAAMTYSDAKDDLLLRAFSGGTQQSTTFGDSAGRLAYGQAQVERQILADDAQRRLGLRTDLTGQAMSSLGAQADVLGQGMQADIAGIGIQRDNRDARMRLLDQYSGQYENAANRYEQGREFGLDLGFRYKQLSTQAALERASIAVQRMNAQTNARELEMRDQWRTQDTQFARLQWLEGIRQWGLEYEQDERQISYGMQQGQQSRDDQRQAQQLATWATVIGLFASDERLKDEIELLPSALDAVKLLRGVSWRWKDTGMKAAGVIAQDVQMVLPDAVVEVNEVLHVDYRALTGLLVEAVKELTKRVERLEGRGRGF